jgi:hypothetical protein
MVELPRRHSHGSSIPVFDIDSDREGSQECEPEDRLNLEKFRTAATVKQVERSELEIRDMRRQVKAYESTVEELRDQVKILTDELAHADMMLADAGVNPRAPSGSALYTSGLTTPTMSRQGSTALLNDPPSPLSAALMDELNAKLRKRRESDASSVSGRDSAAMLLSLSGGSAGSPERERKDIGFVFPCSGGALSESYGD